MSTEKEIGRWSEPDRNSKCTRQSIMDTKMQGVDKVRSIQVRSPTSDTKVAGLPRSFKMSKSQETMKSSRREPT